jgi:hypothetical protein
VVGNLNRLGVPTIAVATNIELSTACFNINHSRRSAKRLLKLPL